MLRVLLPLLVVCFSAAQMFDLSGIPREDHPPSKPPTHLHRVHRVERHGNHSPGPYDFAREKREADLQKAKGKGCHKPHESHVERRGYIFPGSFDFGKRYKTEQKVPPHQPHPEIRLEKHGNTWSGPDQFVRQKREVEDALVDVQHRSPPPLNAHHRTVTPMQAPPLEQMHHPTPPPAVKEDWLTPHPDVQKEWLTPHVESQGHNHHSHRPPANEPSMAPCEGDNCGPTMAPCEGDGCMTMMPCEGEGCFTMEGKHHHHSMPPCEGDNCDPTMAPCEGEGCMTSMMPCEGEDCFTPMQKHHSQHHHSVAPCDGDNCMTPAQEPSMAPCEGPDCVPPCDGDNCLPHTVPPLRHHPCGTGPPGMETPCHSMPPALEEHGCKQGMPCHTTPPPPVEVALPPCPPGLPCHSQPPKITILTAESVPRFRRSIEAAKRRFWSDHKHSPLPTAQSEAEAEKRAVGPPWPHFTGFFTSFF